MDKLDRDILAILQEDGRITATDLAAQVGLSLSACHRRLKELERSGAILGYRAIVAPESVGLSFEAIVFVTMQHTALEVIASFEAAVTEMPSIVEAQRLFGQPDYLLRILARDLADYQEFFDTTLTGLPGVQRLTSTMVMKQIGEERAVPIP